MFLGHGRLLQFRWLAAPTMFAFGAGAPGCGAVSSCPKEFDSILVGDQLGAL